MKRKELWRQVRHNLEDGVLGQWKKWIPLVGAMILLCIYFHAVCNEKREAGLILSSPTLPDYVLFLFRGMKEYIPELDLEFSIPVAWLFFQLYMAFLIGSYAVDDMDHFGLQYLLRAESRKNWYLGKCAYCAGMVTAAYIVSWITILGYALITGVSMGGLTPDIGEQISQIDTLRITPFYFFMNLILLPMLTSLVVSVAQMTLSLFLQPILSFAAAASYQVASAFLVSPFLIGNYSMILRFLPFWFGKLHWQQALLTLIGLMAVIPLLGLAFLKKIDFIGKAENE